MVLGGVESVPYEKLTDGIAVSHVPHDRPFTAQHIARFDAVVCLVSQVAHTAVKSVKRHASKTGVPVFYLRSSGATRFRSFMEQVLEVD